MNDPTTLSMKFVLVVAGLGVVSGCAGTVPPTEPRSGTPSITPVMASPVAQMQAPKVDVLPQPQELRKEETATEEVPFLRERPEPPAPEPTSPMSMKEEPLSFPLPKKETLDQSPITPPGLPRMVEPVSKPVRKQEVPSFVKREATPAPEPTQSRFTVDILKAVKWYRIGKQKVLDQKYREAAEWYRKAADLGHAGAQNSLGILFDLGMGVPQDADRARFWYQKAAEQDYPLSQYNLGLLYEKVYRDAAKARYWYLKASAHGDEDAVKALRRLP